MSDYIYVRLDSDPNNVDRLCPFESYIAACIVHVKQSNK